MEQRMDMNPENYRVSDGTLRDFEQWKEYLSSKVQMAKNAGMNEDTIANSAARVGDFLSTRIEAKNSEERLLKELWDCGTEQEQKALASMIVKMVSDGHRQTH
jgi:hypothetical protein